MLEINATTGIRRLMRDGNEVASATAEECERYLSTGGKSIYELLRWKERRSENGPAVRSGDER